MGGAHRAQSEKEVEWKERDHAQELGADGAVTSEGLDWADLVQIGTRGGLLWRRS